MIVVKKPKFWIFIVLVLVLSIYGLCYRSKLNKEGVITIAKIQRFEATEQGGDLYVTIYFRNKRYNTVVNSLCISCGHSFRYIRILPENPTSHPIFYEKIEVPDCIINQLPYNGWKEIPKDSCQ